MNTKFILLAIIAVATLATLSQVKTIAEPIGIPSAYAEEGNFWGNKDFERSIEIRSVVAVPSGDSGDGSYYFVYGVDPKTGKDRMIEIQLNLWSGTQYWNNMKINRDYPFMMLSDPANYGGIAKFKCNGWSDWESLEKYPTCFQLLDFQKPKKIYFGDLKWFSKDQLKNEIARLQTELNSRQ